MTITFNGTHRSIIGKSLAIGFFAIVMSVATHAQSGNVYAVNSNTIFGYLTSSPNVWRIDLGNSAELKAYNCKDVNATTISCVFTQFKNGQVTHSGDALFTTGGGIYLRWRYENVANVQRSIDSGWIAYQVK